MTDDLTRRLAKLPASAVHDVLRAMGHEPCVLPATIRPLDPLHRVAGPVWTAAGAMATGKSADDTLLAWTALLSQAPAGHVIVCQPNTNAIALMGELSANALMRRGVRGYVVDGGTRDVSDIVALGFPVFCKFATPADITGRWMVGELGGGVEIGGVRIATGDWIVGDRDGVVVIPGASAAEAIARTEQVVGTEGAVRRAILAGEDPQAAYLKYRKF